MTHTGRASRTLSVGSLARVEGEGAMRIRVRDGRVAGVQLQIYEPPRFFEAFLRGRAHTEPPDITARVCGICPVAYQMSACQAIEDACGVAVTGPLPDLRRLLYLGEWIESHALHIYFLHAPDFLGVDGAVELAQRDRATVERGLRLKKAGNAVLETIGGRPIHPVNVRVGGFYRVPPPAQLAALVDPLRWARDAAVETVAWVSGFDFPEFEHDHELVALRQPGRYPVDGGRLVSSGGLDVAVARFEHEFEEVQVPHSSALHARLRQRGRYLVGPLARYSLNHDRLTPLAREVAGQAGLGAECRNPFKSIVVRAVETVHACDEALALLDAFEPPPLPAIEVPARAGRGYGCTEAPRGILYHRYDLDNDGTITSARIVPPTSQNQAAIEDDLARFVQPRLDLANDELTRQCEQAIRNYDPCISCATHFLQVEVLR